jgi:predicted nucleic acid-binding protein
MTFVDSWAWIALADRSDPYHRKAKTQHKKLLQTKRRYVTTDYIVGETITYLFPAIGSVQAQGFVNSLLASADSSQYLLFHLTPDQFRRAWLMRQKYHDKPNISFVAFTSMVVMQDLGILEVFTGDDHFRQVNLGFQLVP